MRDRAAYILVGGKSSRFGSDKALVEVDGKPLVLRLVDAVSEAADRITLVGPPDRYEQIDLPIIPDTQEGIGPLAGIIAALQHTSALWNLILACDLPRFSAVFAEFLFTQAEAGGHDVVMPVSPEGLDEPLCAVYARSATTGILREIEKGTRKITHALEGIVVRRILAGEYAHLDPEGETFTNVNTPADWERYAK